MQMNRILGFAVTAAVVIAAACTAPAAKAAPKTSPAETAIKAAARQHRYVFLTFYEKNDAASTKMLAEARKLQTKYSRRANFVSADVSNAIHQALISRYGADRSPMPLTLVIAPNGAITAGFPKAIDKTDLSDVFVSTGMENVLKVLQDGKLAVVCLQNSKTKNNKENMAAAESLKSDQRFAGVVEVVKIDPSDRSEAKFMQQCKVDTDSSGAQLIVFAPPGRIVGRFAGTATTESITASLMKSLSGGTCGGGGCGSGGCGR